MKFNLTLTAKRANYSPAMRNRFPRVNVAVPVTHSDELITKWAVIIAKTANRNGYVLNLATGKALAHHALTARANGATYAEAVLGAIASFC